MDETLEQVRAAVADLLHRPAWAASTDEQVAVVTGAQVAINQLIAVQAVYARELNAAGFPARHGATSLATWLRDRLRISIFAAKRLVNLGDQLTARPTVADAMATGTVNAEQAAVIATALEDLPDDVGSVVVDACESALTVHAETLEPAALRAVGERILTHIAPEIAEQALLAKLDRDERRARQTRAFTMTPNGAGAVRLTGSLDVESAAVVRAALDPLCRPQPGPDGGRDLRPPAQRRADALVDVCALTLAGGDLPDNGGTRPQVVITLPFDPITRLAGSGRLDTGETLSPAAARRIACDAGIIPAVLGSRSELLDLGRSRRLFDGPIRRALVLRDGGCAFPGCDRPPRWTEGHHILEWLHGGKTDLANGVLLCRRHHRAVHHDGWQIRIGDDQLPEFIPPPYIDPLQRPQRNLYHQRQ